LRHPRRGLLPGPPLHRRARADHSFAATLDEDPLRCACAAAEADAALAYEAWLAMRDGRAFACTATAADRAAAAQDALASAA
jgi:hypothetical protein